MDYFNTNYQKEIIYNKNKEEDRKPSGIQGFWGFITGLGYMTILTIIPFFIINILFGSPTTQAQENIENSIAQMIGGVLALIIFAYISRKQVPLLKKTFSPNLILKGIVYAFMVYGCAILVSIIEETLFGAAETNANQSLLENLFGSAPVIGFVFTVIFAPLIEELMFRYYLFGAISKKSKILAYIASAGIFGLVHMTATISEFIAVGDYSALINDLKSLPDYIVAGALFCYIYDKTKTIWGSIIAHSIYNLLATIISFALVFSSPCRINDVQTSDGCINFVVLANKDTDTVIDKIELYTYDENDQLILTNHSYTVDNERIYFTNLEVDKKYSIKVTYTYNEDSVIGSSVSKTEEVSSYAYASTR